ncbi:phage shock protein PspA [Altererythrobacter sp. H2]|uniref:phage shock protein PspA n=1 Tax=Altererythrobacter sp. H2 TaxID=3108391 RepID=UPI000BD30B7A|nr:phage shock protein PspA [Altererythrobacter sp. H2]OZA94816.1 MAG: phage shock protein PspA [Erythrobacter sp. 34-65-8]WRK96680.1 phage shock protein PspA [Altererythrobacter sp. H2]
MTRPIDHDPLGPERSPPSSDGASARSPRASRLDDEVERLRRSPTPTQQGERRDRGQRDPFPDFSFNGVPLMGIFSRTRDIIAANFTDMLDKADDPAKMIRMIILEMEETLVEVRASAARTIADQKEMHRHTVKLDRLQADWAEKAQLALSKDREDLARAALVEKKKAADMADQLKAEIAVLDDALRAYEQDIAKLQNRLREARSRQTAIAARLESAENRVKLRSLMTNERVDEALTRFDQLERRVDYAEGRAEALSIADGSGKPSLSDEIAALESADKIDDELEQMKRALGLSDDAKKGE